MSTVAEAIRNSVSSPLARSKWNEALDLLERAQALGVVLTVDSEGQLCIGDGPDDWTTRELAKALSRNEAALVDALRGEA